MQCAIWVVKHSVCNCEEIQFALYVVKHTVCILYREAYSMQFISWSIQYAVCIVNQPVCSVQLSSTIPRDSLVDTSGINELEEGGECYNRNGFFQWIRARAIYENICFRDIKLFTFTDPVQCSRGCPTKSAVFHSLIRWVTHLKVCIYNHSQDYFGSSFWGVYQFVSFIGQLVYLPG